MPPRPDPLGSFKVKHLPRGRYADGNKAYLLLRDKDAAFWVFCHTVASKLREMGFTGTGIQDNLADKVWKLGIPVWE